MVSFFNPILYKIPPLADTFSKPYFYPNLSILLRRGNMLFREIVEVWIKNGEKM